MMPPSNTPSSAVRAADFAWLTTAAASQWLAQLAESELPLHTLATKLRRELSDAHTHLLLEQADLRRRGAAKFSRAAQMLFTPRALEQATDEWISRYKAQRFANQPRVADLCCGIGGDLIGLVEMTRATGVDRCEVATFCADHNATVYQTDASPFHSTETADVNNIDLADFSAWHLDPDRRPRGRRTTRVELHEPSLEAIERMLSRQPNAAIKLAPASNLPDDGTWSAATEFEWISRGGECRQLVAWRGALAHDAGQSRATSIGKFGKASLLGRPDVSVDTASALDRYLFEPDSAVLAAHLTGALAVRHELQAVTPGVAYLTGSRLLSEPLLAAFEVLDALPFDRRTLVAYLKARDVGRVEIKHRGLSLDPDRLRKELKLRGDAAAVLIITKLAGLATVLVAQRLVTPGVT